MKKKIIMQDDFFSSKKRSATVLSDRLVRYKHISNGPGYTWEEVRHPEKKEEVI